MHVNLFIWIVCQKIQLMREKEFEIQLWKPVNIFCVCLNGEREKKRVQMEERNMKVYINLFIGSFLIFFSVYEKKEFGIQVWKLVTIFLCLKEEKKVEMDIEMGKEMHVIFSFGLFSFFCMETYYFFMCLNGEREKKNINGRMKQGKGNVC